MTSTEGPGEEMARGHPREMATEMPAGTPVALPFLTAARLVGVYRWVERRLFEVVGSWAAHEPIAQARIFFDVQSRLHAWHADLWEARLPVAHGVDHESLTIPASAELDRVVSGLGGLPAQRDRERLGDPGPAPTGGAGGTLLRLVGLGRVMLPRLIAQYDLHLRRAAPIADAAVMRSLRFVLVDETEAWRQAETLIQALVRRPSDVAVVTAHQQALESLLAGVPGIFAWPAERRTQTSSVRPGAIRHGQSSRVDQAPATAFVAPPPETVAVRLVTSLPSEQTTPPAGPAGEPLPKRGEPDGAQEA